MKTNKHLLSFLIICLVLVMSLASCGSPGTAPADNQPSGQTQEQNNAGIQEDSAGGSGTAADDSRNAPAGEETLLTEEEVIAIVIQRVDGASAGDIVSFRKEYDDGIWQYEGSLIYDGVEYDFEIDAQNGTILDWEIDD